jgi:RNA polymerase sigma factor (sigma-70 family)
MLQFRSVGQHRSPGSIGVLLSMNHGVFGSDGAREDAGQPASFPSDAQALEFIRRYRGAIKWSINSWSIPAHERADIYQDICLRLLMRFRRNGPLTDEGAGGKHLGYVLRLSRNLCLDFKRKSAVRTMAAHSESADVRVQDNEALPDAALFRKQAHERLHLAVEELPPMSKAIMREVLAGKSNQEIADHYEISLGNVKLLRHRARKLLRERLVRK